MAISSDNLSRLHAAIIAGGVAINGVDINGSVTPSNLQSAAQPIIDAFVDTPEAQATWIARQQKAQAAASIDNGALVSGDKHERIVRALVGLMLDEFNAHAVKINAILTASDAATSLADFQTRMRQIAAYPARTAEQLVTAIKTKLAETPE